VVIIVLGYTCVVCEYKGVESKCVNILLCVSVCGVYVCRYKCVCGGGYKCVWV